MNLTELFRNPKLALKEGGNLSSQSPGWQGVPGDHQAVELDLNVHNRAYVQSIVGQTLQAINDVFAQQHNEPLWHEESVKTQKFLSGSTFQFMDKKISDEEFVRVKPKVGDIDTQASDKHAETIKSFLSANVGKQIGNAVLIGFSPGNSQFTSLWEIKLKDLPVKIQIDFEYGAHEETGLPTDWQSYSHSSSWDDISQNIKGVFHKYLDRALPYAQASTKYVARVLKKSTKISDAPVTDSDYSFAVSGPGGGGVSQKYVPYTDPATGQPMVKDGIPVMQLLEPGARQYIQNLAQQFEIFFGRKPKGNDQELKNSFVGTVQLIAKYLDEQKKEEIARRFFSICFEPGSQMITKDDPIRDRDIKFAAIDYMLENMKLANAAELRKQAIDMATAYAAAFQNKTAAKTAPLKEQAEVKAQLRKGMPHLHDLKPADLLDLLDEIHDGNGNFKLQNIPLNVKVDGFGGRFGKNSEGKPFMGTSRTEPRYEPGFVAYHQKKGTTDPEVLGRAQMFDDLFTEMMAAVKLVDSKLGPGFLVNKQVTCEVLYLPFATETPEGKLKFVGIHYDKLPAGVKLALVPFRITDATTGEDLPNSNQIVKELTSVGQSGSVMFIDNSLTQNEALDVTALVPPVENIDELKAMLASNKLEARRQVKAALEPVAAALERAIIQDPNIVGKDMLGQDYEGIVINSRLGPIKVTSQEQRDVITAKNAAKASARAERPRENQNKTAVVAIGSFVGHVGHEQLFDYTLKKAAAVGGDPYLFIGNAQGKDDPIPPAVKVQTWHKLYPEYAKNISTVNEAGGTLLQKIKHELINPLPGKPPRYDNIIIMVGEDQAGLTMPQALMKAVNKFPGYEHVKVSLEATPRGTGMSFTRLRNILKDPNATEQQQLAVWSQGFDVQKLGVDWVKHLMDLTRKGMGIQQPKAPVPQPQPAPLSEQRILNALVKGPMKEGWSQKYKSSINCSHPKGFSQKAHCAGKKKHDESVEMEMTCPDCGMCETHGNNMMEVKQRLDAKCWKGKHKEGTKIKGGVRVNNCVPNEGVAEGSSYNIDQDDHDEFTPDEIVRIKNSHFPDTLRDNLRAAKKEARRAKHFSSSSDGGETNLGSPVGSSSDNTYEGVAEARMSAAQRLWNAEQKQRAKSDASLARTPSSIPKPEPKKDEKTNEEGGVGVIASKKQAKDPRYSTSLTVDVRPGQVKKNLKAFNLAEKMMPASNFAGSKKNKLGPAGQWKNTGPKKNKPAQAGDLVGGMEEGKKPEHNLGTGWMLDKDKELGRKVDQNRARHKELYKATPQADTNKKKSADRYVPMSENVENIMDALINKIIVNEAIQNNRK